MTHSLILLSPNLLSLQRTYRIPTVNGSNFLMSNREGNSVVVIAFLLVFKRVNQNLAPHLSTQVSILLFIMDVKQIMPFTNIIFRY
jgi:hypothetical protein